jgi:hypothetical protein
MTIKQNDTYPPLRVTLTDSTDTAVDVTGATVTFRMVDAADTNIVDDKACSLITPASGIVEYQWLAADTDTAGDFRGEFHVTFVGGAIGTFPNDGYVHITIVPELAEPAV